jgi:hypothetical protein
MHEEDVSRILLEKEIGFYWRRKQNPAGEESRILLAKKTGFCWRNSARTFNQIQASISFQDFHHPLFYLNLQSPRHQCHRCPTATLPKLD